MKVKELIDELSKYDEEKEVWITCTYDMGGGTAGGTIIQVFEHREAIELYNDEC